MMIGHNSLAEIRQSSEWQKCVAMLGDELMEVTWALRSDAFKLEAAHLLLLQNFGEDYRSCVFADLVRRHVYNATGREIK